MARRVATCPQRGAHRASKVCALPRAIRARALTFRAGAVVQVAPYAGVRVPGRCSRVGRTPERRRAAAGEASLCAARPHRPAHHLQWWPQAWKAVATKQSNQSRSGRCQMVGEGRDAVSRWSEGKMCICFRFCVRRLGRFGSRDLPQCECESLFLLGTA